MVYLIAQVSLFLVVASLIGLSLGWLLWGELARRIRTEAASLQSKLSDLEIRHWATLSERDEFEKKALDREGEFAGLRKRALEPAMAGHELEAKIQAAVAEKELAIAQLREQQRAALGLVEERDKAIIELRGRLGTAEGHEHTLTGRAREWEAAMADKDGMIAQLSSKLIELEARQHGVIAEKDQQMSELESKIQGLFTQHQILAAGQEKLRNTVAERDGEIARMQTRLTGASAAQAAASKEREAALSAAAAEIARLRKMGAVLNQPLPHDEVVRIAHGYATARNFVGGSEQEDWSRAENAVRLQILQEYLAQGSSVAAGA